MQVCTLDPIAAELHLDVVFGKLEKASSMDQCGRG
jgi:hypothetical protein